ncbi:MAG: hypothetical protein AAFQ02_07015 [Bacteroidota bacterium]
MEDNDLQYLNQYMVEFDVPPLSDDLLDLIPDQRDVVDDMFASGKLLSYSLTEDRRKLWAVMLAQSESELIMLIDMLPMTGYMDYNYHELMFHNTVHLIPSMSLN